MFICALCTLCKHYDKEKTLAVGFGSLDPDHSYFCAAYPDGIPGEIYFGDVNHYTPRPDDNGLQFEMIDPEDIGFLRYFFEYPW